LISLRHPFLRPALFCSALLAMLTGCERNLPKLTDFYQPDASITQTPLPDFRNYAVVQEKKDAFVGFMLPLIHEANREILAERQLLEHLSGTQTPAEGHPRPLKKLVKKYRIADGTRQEQIDALLEQVNVIPPSLVLAQAANESAWGTSRFAREGNNLFGEWCFSKGCGLVPKRRPSGAYHEVASFKKPFYSVQSYMLNINRHDSYAQLRSLRNKQISGQGYATGNELAAGLINYSQRGRAYIQEIRSMISVNDFGRFDLPDSDPAE